MDRIALFFDLEDDKRYSKRFKKFIMWMGYKFVPFVLQITSIIVIFYIAFKIFGNYGFERTAIVLLVLILISVRGLKKKEED